MFPSIKGWQKEYESEKKTKRMNRLYFFFKVLIVRFTHIAETLSFTRG